MDALTEGEGSIEDELASLVDDDSAILNPRDLFAKAVDVTENDINAADYAFWQVETPTITGDPLITYAENILHGTAQPYIVAATRLDEPTPVPQVNLLHFRTDYYLKQAALRNDTPYLDSLRAILGILENGLLTSTPTDEPHETTLIQAVADELNQNRIVFPGCEREVANQVIYRAKQVYASEPISDPVEQEAYRHAQPQREPEPILSIVPKPHPQPKPKRRFDLNAPPDDEPSAPLTIVPPVQSEQPTYQQMQLFA